MLTHAHTVASAAFTRTPRLAHAHILHTAAQYRYFRLRRNTRTMAESTGLLEMSELPGDSSVPQVGTASGVSDILQGAVGGGVRMQESQEGPVAEATRSMARVPSPVPEPIPSSVRGLASAPDPHQQLAFLEINRQLLFREYLDGSSMIPVRLLRDFEERRRLFVEGCRAREAAFDADPPQMDFAAVAFTVALTASEALSPLAD